MRCVLGIDAAWGEREPSALALVAGAPGAWRCLRIVPSFADFVRPPAADDGTVPERRPPGGRADVAELLAACRLAGGVPDVIALDLPLARGPVRGRREADNAVSRAFGAAHCGTHTPPADTPGCARAALQAGFEDAGFRLATMRDSPGRPSMLEVYPHPALLRLMSVKERVPYKISRAARYWPDLSPEARRTRIIERHRGILDALRREIAGIPLRLPPARPTPPAARLKTGEDMIDALICAWIGLRWLEGACEAYGDDAAAVWIPR